MEREGGTVQPHHTQAGKHSAEAGRTSKVLNRGAQASAEGAEGGEDPLRVAEAGV